MKTAFQQLFLLHCARKECFNSRFIFNADQQEFQQLFNFNIDEKVFQTTTSSSMQMKKCFNSYSIFNADEKSVFSSVSYTSPTTFFLWRQGQTCCNHRLEFTLLHSWWLSYITGYLQVQDHEIKDFFKTF